MVGVVDSSIRISQGKWYMSSQVGHGCNDRQFHIASPNRIPPQNGVHDGRRCSSTHFKYFVILLGCEQQKKTKTRSKYVGTIFFYDLQYTMRTMRSEPILGDNTRTRVTKHFSVMWDFEHSKLTQQKMNKHFVFTRIMLRSAAICIEVFFVCHEQVRRSYVTKKFSQSWVFA